MKPRASACGLLLSVAYLGGLLPLLQAAEREDWPQFMGQPEHTGDGADVTLTLPLGLMAQVKLDDAILASPVASGGRVYAVDQMGTAYAIDPAAGKVLWKCAPDGTAAMGSNTSSPCIVKDRLIFGTTSGKLHVLDAKAGQVLKSIDLGAPVVSAITAANDVIYFQTVDGTVHARDLDGKARWTWEHYKRYAEPPEITKKEAPNRGHPGSYDQPHYGGGEVAVSDTAVVTSIGWDIFCLTDRGTTAELAWCRRCPAGRDGPTPMSASISGGIVYAAGMGADGALGLMRFALKDGTTAAHVQSIAYPWSTPAVRGSTVVTRGEYDRRDQLGIYDAAAKKGTGIWAHPVSATPVAGSQVFAKDHCITVTLNGEVIVSELAPKPGAKPFIYTTPNSKGIGAAPALAGGRIIFGCDDGYLYVLGSGGTLETKKDPAPSIHQPRAKVKPATGKAYGWNSALASGANTCCVDDPKLAAPLRLRWAVRGFGHFKTSCIATAEGDLLSVTLDRTVTCLEQETGRLRWRRRLPPESGAWGSSSGLLAEGGRVYVPCANGRPKSELFCLSLADGATHWSAPIGETGIWDRNAPVFAAGKVAFGFVKKGIDEPTVIQAWDAATGAEAWRVTMDVTPAHAAGGCTDGKTMFFSAGREKWGWKPEGARKRGELVAIDAASGKVIWKTNDRFSSASLGLSGSNLIVQEYPDALRCLSTADGSELWNGGQCGLTRLSIGPDFVAMRGYGGGADKRSLKNGSAATGLEKGGNLGGLAHACGPVALTTGGLSLAISVSGLSVRDAVTGKLLWQSPGFAPRACVNATIANGRVFFPTAASGMLYCWEPAATK